jgi:peptidyl-prolyl cis-trans isomerase SurA
MFREQRRQELMITQLERRDVMSRISITQREMNLCLARSAETETDEFDYNVSHILIGFSPDAAPAAIRLAEDRINELRAELDSGADFAQLALAYSESQTALEGGSLGWRKGSELPTIFSDTVIRMQPTDYSQPIRTGSGFHLVRLNDMRGAEPVVVDQIRVRHILISPNEILDDDATMQKLIGIRNQILAGDDFATVAESISEDTQSAAEGGDLGWAEGDAYVGPFTAIIESLPIGELSEPFRTEFGWHIAEVIDRRAYDTTDDLKELSCQREIGNSKVEEERELWLRRIRDQAFISIKL